MEKSLLQKEGRKIFCNEEKGGRMGSLAWRETGHTSQASSVREKKGVRKHRDPSAHRNPIKEEEEDGTERLRALSP